MAETTLSCSSVSLFRSLQEFHEATPSLREMNFPGTGVGRGRKADAMTTTRRIEIRNFYMCPGGIDFRMSTTSSFRCTLPFPAPGTLSFSQLQSFVAFQGNKSIARTRKKWGCKVYTRWKSVTTMC